MSKKKYKNSTNRGGNNRQTSAPVGQQPETPVVPVGTPQGQDTGPSEPPAGRQTVVSDDRQQPDIGPDDAPGDPRPGYRIRFEQPPQPDSDVPQPRDDDVPPDGGTPFTATPSPADRYSAPPMPPTPMASGTFGAHAVPFGDSGAMVEVVGDDFHVDGVVPAYAIITPRGNMFVTPDPTLVKTYAAQWRGVRVEYIGGRVARVITALEDVARAEAYYALRGRVDA